MAAWGDSVAKTAREAYRKNLSRLDGLFGALLDRIAAAGLPNDTVTIVFSDHGDALGERSKDRAFGPGGSLFDEHVHVPLLFKVPGRAAGTKARDSPRAARRVERRMGGSG